MRSSLTGLLVFAVHLLYSQELLVNGNFEEENICLEYKVNCAPEAWFTNDEVFNNYFKDASGAYEGSHFMSIQAGHALKSFKRTFIRSQLLCGLRKGSMYRLEFFVRSPHRVLDSLGVYFTSVDFLMDKRPLQTLRPSFYLAEVKQFNKSDGWQHVRVDYRARGDEAFISIGNFSKRDITGHTGLPGENRFAAFIDLVSLKPMHADEKLCDDWQSRRQEIYDQDERHEWLQRRLRAEKPVSRLPLVQTPNTVQRVDTLVLQEVLFETGAADLSKKSYFILDSFSQNAYGKSVDSVVVEGHTDNRGAEEMNNRLSSARVQTVLNYFATRSFVKPSRVYARAWGESRPIAPNTTPEGRQRNRRVVVFLYIRE